MRFSEPAAFQQDLPENDREDPADASLMLTAGTAVLRLCFPDDIDHADAVRWNPQFAVDSIFSVASGFPVQGTPAESVGNGHAFHFAGCQKRPENIAMQDIPDQITAGSVSQFQGCQPEIIRIRQIELPVDADVPRCRGVDDGYRMAVKFR